MPTYEYVCKKCKKNTEAVQSFHDAPLTVCPHCGGELRKVFGAVGISFKGSGFYKTDSRARTKETAGSSSASDTKGSDSKGAESKSTDSKGSDSKSTESKSTDSKGSDSKSSDSKSSDSKGTGPSSRSSTKAPATTKS